LLNTESRTAGMLAATITVLLSLFWDWRSGNLFLSGDAVRRPSNGVAFDRVECD
jgi:hypothetical protein